MDYTVHDLARYSGFIVGCSATYVLMGQLGIESHLGKLVAGIAVGLVLGWVGDQALQPQKKTDGRDE